MRKIFKSFNFPRIIKSTDLQKIYQFENFISPEICCEILNYLSEEMFERAHQFERGRHNKECFSKDRNVMDLIHLEIENLGVSKRKVKAVSYPLEFYRYDKGDFISPHSDSPVRLFNGEMSNFTALIYLNDDFHGGDTVFPNLKINIKPKRGSLLLFDHDLVHESQEIIWGTKYIYRANWQVQ